MVFSKLCPVSKIGLVPGLIAFLAAMSLYNSTALAQCVTAGDATVFVDANSQLVFQLPVTDTQGDFTTVLGACANGTVERVPGTTSTVAYTPNQNYYGPDSFAYFVKPADQQCDAASQGLISINPCAVASDATVFIYHMKSTSFDLPIMNGESGFIVTLGKPDFGGRVTFAPGDNDTVIFTPGKLFTGHDRFDYTVQSTATPGSGCGVTHGQITIVNPPPVAGDSTVYVASAGATLITPEITANGHNLIPGQITVNYGTATWTLDTTPTISYTPELKRSADVLLQYSVGYESKSIFGGVHYATGTIKINPCAAATDAFYETQGFSMTFDLPIVDAPHTTFPLTIQQPANGTVTLVAGTTSTVSYVKNPLHFGTDTFTYTVGLQGKLCGASTGEITINSIKPPKLTCPGAEAAVALTEKNTSITVSLPIDGKASEVTLTDPANGTASVLFPSRLGQIVYTPDADFTGVDSLVYTATSLGCVGSTNTVTVAVAPQNACPSADSVELNIEQGQTAEIDLSSSHIADPDANALTTWIVSPPAHGTATMTTDGTLSYTPDPSYTGLDTITYKTTDGTCSAQADVTLSVTEPASAVEGWSVY